MLPDIKILTATALPGYKLELRFDDNTVGIADLSAKVGSGVFAIWSDFENFKNFSLTEDNEVISWGEDIDIDALSLYFEITNIDPVELLNGNH